MSDLREAMVQYLAIRRSLGFALRESGYILGKFVSFAESEDASHITTNLVLRWEWRPGSTLFVIWQLNHGDFMPVTSPDPASIGDWGDAITSPGQSFFALKLTYWLPI